MCFSHHWPFSAFMSSAQADIDTVFQLVDTWVKVKSQDLPQFTDQVNSVGKHITLTRGLKNSRLAFLELSITLTFESQYVT